MMVSLPILILASIFYPIWLLIDAGLVWNLVDTRPKVFFCFFFRIWAFWGDTSDTMPLGWWCCHVQIFFHHLFYEGDQLPNKRMKKIWEVTTWGMISKKVPNLRRKFLRRKCQLIRCWTPFSHDCRSWFKEQPRCAHCFSSEKKSCWFDSMKFFGSPRLIIKITLKSKF